MIAAAGDIIFQPELETHARANGTPYRSLWRAIEPVISGADLAYANIEGPVAVNEAAVQTATAAFERRFSSAADSSSSTIAPRLFGT